MFKNLATVSNNKSSVFLLVLALIVGGVGAQATGLLNTSSGGYLVCVNSTTKVVTHPGTSSCPKGSKKLVLGAQGAAGTNGLTGAAGLSGRDGTDGKDGKTLWNGVKDPESTWGAPGDMYINSLTKTLFGPKDLTTGWPAGVIMVGATGAAGPQGPGGATGAAGPQGPGGATGAAGPAGAAGAIGPAGAAGAGGSSITELFLCDGPDAGTVANEKCKIGMTGPGGGLIFFVDYNDQYAGFNYLEAAPTDGVFAASAASGVWATTVTTCGASSDASCQTNSIYTQTGTALATIKGLHRGLFGGQAATNAIIAKHSGVALNLFAAGVADSYTAPAFNGVTISDYYLPTKDEIELMQKNLNNSGVGGFVDNRYWSSSEVDATGTWRQNFFDGTQSGLGKGFTYFVRPVRAF